MSIKTLTLFLITKIEMKPNGEENTEDWIVFSPLGIHFFWELCVQVILAKLPRKLQIGRCADFRETT